MAVVDVEFRANANFSGLISQANMANAAISKLQASVTSLNAEQINQAFSQFSKGLTGSGQYIAQTVRVSDATQRFGQDLVNNKLQLKDYAREFGNYVTGRESQIKKLADQQVRMQKSMVVTRGTDSTGRLVAQVFTPTGLSNDLETNAMRATSRIQVMNEFLHKASTSVVNWGKNTQWAGRQMTVGLTVPLSMLATATGKAFYELDTQLVQMQKVYGTGIKGVGDEAIASIRSQVTQLSQELAKAYGIPVAQTAALAAEIAQAGKTGNELLSSVEQTTKLATLGEIDRQDAMKATLSIQSTFNQNTKELGESINFLNAVENSTNVSLQDLVTGIPKAGPVVKALGGDIKDLSLMMVAMKEGGIPASEAANAIKSSLASLINPTQKVSEKMRTFGIDLTAIVDKNAGKLMPTLMEFRGELDKLDSLSRQRILEELFGKFQFARVNALFNNLGRAGSQTVEVMKLMGLSTAELAGIADKELKTMAESASGRFKRLWATVQGDLAVAGQGILNAGSMILSVIDKIINGFEKLPDGLKKFLGGTALLAAVIGPIIMTIGVLGNFFGYIMKGLALMRSFGRRGAGDFQLMTAETVAMADAGDILENKLFDQAKAADLMRTSIEKLTMSLAEMGTVSSTASKAINDVMANAQGRAAAAGTATGAFGGHTLSKDAIESFGLTAPPKEGEKPSSIGVIRGGIIAMDPEANQNMGTQSLGRGVSGNEPGKEFNISTQQVAEGYGANRAFYDIFGERNQKDRAKIAAILADDTRLLEDRYKQLETELGIENPAKLHADFLRKTSERARIVSGDIKRIYSASGADLDAELADSVRVAQGEFKQGKAPGSATYSDYIKSEMDYIDKAETPEEKTARKRDAALRLRQIDQRGGQTLQTGGRGLIGDDPSVQGSRALTGVTGLPGAPGATTLKDIGLPSGGDITSERESIKQLSNDRKELGEQIRQTIAVEKKAQAEDKKFIAQKESEIKALTPVMRQRLSNNQGLSNAEKNQIADIRKNKSLDNDQKTQKINEIKERARAAKEEAKARADNNKQIRDEIATRKSTAIDREAAANQEVEDLKKSGRAIRDEEISRVEGAKRRRSVTPTPTATTPGGDSSVVVVGGVPGGVDEDGKGTGKKRSGKGAAIGSVAGMAAMVGSSMLPSGGLQNAAMAVSTAAMFAQPLMAFKKEADPDKVSKFGNAISGLTSKFKSLGGTASTALRGLGSALMSPIGLAIAAIAAIGVGVYTLFKNLEKGFKGSQSWMDSSKESAEALGYKYQDINFTTKELAGNTEKAKTAVEGLSKAIQDAPESNPLKKMAEDFKNDASSADTVQKAVGFFQLQIARGVDENKAREQLAAVLTNAGQEVLIPLVNVEIGKINTSDRGGNLADALSQGLTTAKKQGWQEFSQTVQTGWQGIIAGVAKATDATTGWTNFTSGAMKTLAGDVQTANNAFDEGAMANLATTFGQVVQEQAKLDPTKWQEFVTSLSNNDGLNAIVATEGGLQQLGQSFLTASGHANDPAWKDAAASLTNVGDLANLSAINFYKIVPAATAAGRAAQVSMLQAANAATAAAVAAAGVFAAGLIKKPSAGGGGGKTADPYEGQKKANQKRIDQEKDIIKAIEKKRDAEKKAFDEKKRQDDYLKKQADLQIGYREALATGDFGAAAMVKNEMLAEQARKRAEDAQQKKEDQYQRDIEARQGNVGRLEEVSGKLDKLSQKARETSAATSAAAMDQYNTNVNTATTTMTTLIDDQKTHNYATVQEFREANPKLVKTLKGLGVDVNAFFTRAYKVGTSNINANIANLEGVNDDVKASLIKLLLSVNDIASLGGWIAGETKAGRPPTSAQILAKATEIKKQRATDAAIKAAAKADAAGQKRQQEMNDAGGNVLNDDGSFTNSGDQVTYPSHSGGPIGPGMRSSMFGKSLRGPIANDERFILAQDGEYMISAAAAGIIGRNNLDAINNGKLPAVPVSGGSSGSSNVFNIYGAEGQDAKQIAQEVHRIFQINERRKGGARI